MNLYGAMQPSMQRRNAVPPEGQILGCIAAPSPNHNIHLLPCPLYLQARIRAAVASTLTTEVQTGSRSAPSFNRAAIACLALAAGAESAGGERAATHREARAEEAGLARVFCNQSQQDVLRGHLQEAKRGRDRAARLGFVRVDRPL